MCNIALIYFHTIEPQTPLVEVQEIPAIKDLKAEGYHITKTVTHMVAAPKTKEPIPTKLEIHLQRESEKELLRQELEKECFALAQKGIGCLLNMMKDLKAEGVSSDINLEDWDETDPIPTPPIPTPAPKETPDRSGTEDQETVAATEDQATPDLAKTEDKKPATRKERKKERRTGNKQ